MISSKKTERELYNKIKQQEEQIRDYQLLDKILRQVKFMSKTP
jgi:hypothetical protein